jgi:hypothetical protein
VVDLVRSPSPRSSSLPLLQGQARCRDQHIAQRPEVAVDLFQRRRQTWAEEHDTVFGTKTISDAMDAGFGTLIFAIALRLPGKYLCATEGLHSFLYLQVARGKLWIIASPSSFAHF